MKSAYMMNNEIISYDVCVVKSLQDHASDSCILARMTRSCVQIVCANIIMFIFLPLFLLYVLIIFAYTLEMYLEAVDHRKCGN